MPYALESYRDALEQAGWPEYLAGQMRDFSREAELAGWNREPLKIETFADALDACTVGNVLSTPVSVILTEAVRRVGGFLEDRLNAEDHDLTLRLGECNGFVAVRSPVTVAYRRH
jgi:hypothetical protein